MGNKTELAVTNKKGEYLLKQVASDDILIFSKEGYVSKEMSVEGRSVLNVRLQIDIVFRKYIQDN